MVDNLVQMFLLISAITHWIVFSSSVSSNMLALGPKENYIVIVYGFIKLIVYIPLNGMADVKWVLFKESESSTNVYHLIPHLHGYL